MVDGDHETVREQLGEPLRIAGLPARRDVLEGAHAGHDEHGMAGQRPSYRPPQLTARLHRNVGAATLTQPRGQLAQSFLRLREAA